MKPKNHVYEITHQLQTFLCALSYPKSLSLISFELAYQHFVFYLLRRFLQPDLPHALLYFLLIVLFLYLNNISN